MDPVIFFSTFGLVFLAELGDKTQLAALALATKYPWTRVLLGVAAAFAVLNLAAVGVGKGLLLLVPRFWILLASAALFLAFGISTLQGPERPETPDPTVGTNHPVLRSFLLILLAELGDKTQLATAGLAAQHDAPVTVFAGSTLALWSVSLLSVAIGRRLLLWVPLPIIHRAAGVLFLVFAAVALLQALTG